MTRPQLTREQIYFEALSDISNFHDVELKEREKKWGFLGWTCCSQLRNIAEAALSRTQRRTQDATGRGGGKARRGKK